MPTDRTDSSMPGTSPSDARPSHDDRNADSRKTKRDDEEPHSETIGGRSFAGASYGATEREQTRDLRKTDPAEEGDVADGGYSDELENDSTGE
ncbi:MAG: hypothetical protein ACHQRK_09995 [Gemmatimonadales bacterium]|jgi:hypothetical protein